MIFIYIFNFNHFQVATLAQLGERQTEDLKALCSIHRSRTFFFSLISETLQLNFH
jgi:hypothetical protein